MNIVEITVSEIWDWKGKKYIKTPAEDTYHTRLVLHAGDHKWAYVEPNTSGKGKSLGEIIQVFDEKPSDKREGDAGGTTSPSPPADTRAEKRESYGDQRRSIERQVCVKESVQLWGEYLDLADVLTRAEVLYQWIQDGGIPEKGQFPATWEEYQARSHLEEVVKDMGGVEVPATDSEGNDAGTPRLKDSTPEELPVFKTVGEFGNYCLKHSKKGALDKFLKDMGLKSVQEIKDIKAAAKVVLG